MLASACGTFFSLTHPLTNLNPNPFGTQWGRGGPSTDLRGSCTYMHYTFHLLRILFSGHVWMCTKYNTFGATLWPERGNGGECACSRTCDWSSNLTSGYAGLPGGVLSHVQGFFRGKGQASISSLFSGTGIPTIQLNLDKKGK